MKPSKSSPPKHKPGDYVWVVVSNTPQLLRIDMIRWCDKEVLYHVGNMGPSYPQREQDVFSEKGALLAHLSELAERAGIRASKLKDCQVVDAVKSGVNF